MMVKLDLVDNPEDENYDELNRSQQLDDMELNTIVHKENQFY